MFVTAPGRRRPGATVRAVVAVVDLEPMAPEQPTDGEAAFSVAEATDHRL
jgi:hypothetical protein